MELPVNINECTNIQKYKQSLLITNTSLEIKYPTIHPYKQYSIEYNINTRKLIVDKVPPSEVSDSQLFMPI
jgi:hypothetical protein